MHRILIFLFVISVIKILFDAFKFVKCFVKNERFETDSIDNAFRWCSIAYIITIIITGL